MAFTYNRLVASGIAYVASGVAADIYTHNTGSYTTSYIRVVIIHNTNTTDESVTLYYRPAGVTITSAHEFYKETISAGATRIIELAVPGIILTANSDAISGVTTTGSKVTVQLYGAQE
jgi:hypothetical protein